MRKTNEGLKYDPRLHKYQYEDTELTSVTTWMKEYFLSEFTENNKHIFISNAVAKKNKREGEGITRPDDQRRYWNLQGERTAANGTAAHAFVQMLDIAAAYDMEVIPDTGYERAVKAAYEYLSNEWEFIELEKQVYSVAYRLAGHIDAIIRHRVTGRLGILDWKTIRDMVKWHDKMREEMKIYKDDAVTKTTLQLTIYTIIGELGIQPEDMFIVQLIPDGTYIIYGGHENPLIDIRLQVKTALSKREDITQSILDLL